MSQTYPTPGSRGLFEVTCKPKALGSLASGPDVALALMHNISEEGFSVPAHGQVLLCSLLGGPCAPSTGGWHVGKLAL